MAQKVEKNEVVQEEKIDIKSLNIYQRMSLATDKIQRVAKNLTVTTGKASSYKAVSETDILDAVKPVEFECGIYSYPYERKILETNLLETETQQGYTRKQMFMRLESIYRFINVDNPTEYIEITSYGDGIDSGDKLTGKAMTYCDKYALMKAYKISTGDDPDQTASEELKEAKPNTRKQSATHQQAPKQQKQMSTQDFENIKIDLMREIKTYIDTNDGFKQTVIGILKANEVRTLSDLSNEVLEELVKTGRSLK